MALLFIALILTFFTLALFIMELINSIREYKALGGRGTPALKHLYRFSRYSNHSFKYCLQSTMHHLDDESIKFLVGRYPRWFLEPIAHKIAFEDFDENKAADDLIALFGLDNYPCPPAVRWVVNISTIDAQEILKDLVTFQKHEYLAWLLVSMTDEKEARNYAKWMKKYAPETWRKVKIKMPESSDRTKNFQFI